MTVVHGPSRPLSFEELDRVEAKLRELDGILEPRGPVEYWDFPDRLRGKPAIKPED